MVKTTGTFLGIFCCNILMFFMFLFYCLPLSLCLFMYAKFKFTFQNLRKLFSIFYFSHCFNVCEIQIQIPKCEKNVININTYKIAYDYSDFSWYILLQRSPMSFIFMFYCLFLALFFMHAKFKFKFHNLGKMVLI